MSGFSADWLTLREPYDLRSRNAMVLDAVAAHLEPNFSVRIVDLARAMVGPQVTLILLSAPAAVDYYPKIGMERFKDCFIFRRSE